MILTPEEASNEILWLMSSNVHIITPDLISVVERRVDHGYGHIRFTATHSRHQR
jgi:hypothetical protein